ncbi:MAG: magnesium chelatase subunit D [Pseudomonadota bacterium]
MNPPATPWARATRALALFAIDPAGLGGIWVRARSGPVRDAFLALLEQLPETPVKVHPAMSDEALFGGLDINATLTAGRPVQSPGLLQGSVPLLLTMAERTSAARAARLAQSLDGGASAIALDEGEGSDEGLAGTLVERLGLFVELDGLRLADVAGAWDEGIGEARARLSSVIMDASELNALADTAARLGIRSLRAPLFARSAARAHAALAGRSEVAPEDLEIAVALAFGHKATRLPEPEEALVSPDPMPECARDDNPAGSDDPDHASSVPEEVLLQAVAAALPADVLKRLASGRTRSPHGGGSGQGAPRSGSARGRPLPARPGRPSGADRIDVLATLRAAAPWQGLRAARPGGALAIRKEDIRLRRNEERTDRCLIFTVDASGSAAVARLAEAKGAIEHLLVDAYASRDHVALVAFRGTGAEMLLPPTRSLVQTKRRLAALPGGGGTPLAAGLDMAGNAAVRARSKGMAPTIILLTDGRANIARDGSANREQAAADAETAARTVRALDVPSVLIDTSVRPRGDLAALSGTLNARYVPLPRADGADIAKTVTQSIDHAQQGAGH